MTVTVQAPVAGATRLQISIRACAAALIESLAPWKDRLLVSHVTDWTERLPPCMLIDTPTRRSRSGKAPFECAQANDDAGVAPVEAEVEAQTATSARATKPEKAAARTRSVRPARRKKPDRNCELFGYTERTRF